MLMPTEDLKTDNAALLEMLSDYAKEGRRVAQRHDRKISRLYARNDQLEELLREHKVPIPDWPHAETGGV